MVQTGESVNQVKDPKAHAALQGICRNLITALKLLANQQEDGDGFIQNIVTNLCEVSRQSSCSRSRTGNLWGPFLVRRPKGLEGHPEVTVRESPDELTLGAEEVGTWK